MAFGTRVHKSWVLGPSGIGARSYGRPKRLRPGLRQLGRGLPAGGDHGNCALQLEHRGPPQNDAVQSEFQGYSIP